MLFGIQLFFVFGALTLLHSERPKLYGVLAVLNAIGLSVDHKTHTLSITKQNNVGIRSYIAM